MDLENMFVQLRHQEDPGPHSRVEVGKTALYRKGIRHWHHTLECAKVTQSKGQCPLNQL